MIHASFLSVKEPETLCISQALLTYYKTILVLNNLISYQKYFAVHIEIIQVQIMLQLMKFQSYQWVE